MLEMFDEFGKDWKSEANSQHVDIDDRKDEDQADIAHVARLSVSDPIRCWCVRPVRQSSIANDMRRPLRRTSTRREAARSRSSIPSGPACCLASCAFYRPGRELSPRRRRPVADPE